MPGYFLRNGSQHFLMHDHHQTEDQQQVHREQSHMDVVGDLEALQAEVENYI